MFKTVTAFAHCDLPCGVYDPAQAKIEAQSIKATMEKYAASSDAGFKSRAVAIKEERSELVDRKSTRLNSSHTDISRMPSSA